MKTNSKTIKNPPEKTAKPISPAPAKPGPPPPPKPGPVAPLFRRIDWLALIIAFAVVWTIYFLTLAPEQTLEDSGELCTGAFYAGIPHPPGYPFWSIYAWLWTKLLPVGNVAWRVEVGEATAAAMACGLVAFMVSRGSSLLVEGIDELKQLPGKWENAICLISGVVAGLLLGLGGVMWSESVAINRISLFGVPWVMMVMLCLFRWIYAPHQRRYLFIGLFFLGISVTVHQTLLVAAVGIEIAIAYVQPRLGKEIYLWNSILWIAGMIAQATGLITMLNTSTMVLLIFHAVGIASIIVYFWLSVRIKETFDEFCRDGALAATVLFLAASPGGGLGGAGYALFLVSLLLFVWFAWKTCKIGLEWLVVICLGLLWVLGASFYFYEAIAGMTNPPMEWGYPRTVEGFFHALSRGQYEKANPSPIFQDPFHFLLQIGMLTADIVHEYNWVCLFIALVPLLFFLKMQKRERAWILALVAVYIFIGGLLLILMNPQPDKQSADLSRVFFTSSHALIAIMIGYGFALTAAYFATHYQRFRTAGLMLGIVALVPALASFYNGISNTFYGGIGFVPYNIVLLLLVLLAGSLVLTALAAQRVFRLSDPAAAATRQEDRNFLYGFGAGAIILLAISLGVVFFREESLSMAQLTGSLGRMFAAYQYNLPAVAGVLILGIVVGFIVALFTYRQRAPLAITLGLFALMPLASGLSHWAGCEQRNHWFGYWFGHDMFNPPVIGPDGKLTYDSKTRQQMMQSPSKALVYPEMDKDTILFGGTDPGRFNPTYMIFCDSFIPDSCKPVADSTFDRRDVYLITQNALADGTYLNYLRAQYFRSQQKDPPFFSELGRYILKDPDYKTNFVARMVSPLDDIFESRGARIERRWRTGSSLFSDKDFVDLPGFAGKLRPNPAQDPVSKWLFDNFTKETQDALTGGREEQRLRGALAKDLNVLLERELKQKEELAEKQREKDRIDEKAIMDSSEKLRRQQEDIAKAIAAIHIQPLYDSNRFAQVNISDYLKEFIAQNPQGDTRIRLNRLLLEAAYPSQIAKSLGGVYPDREIYIPSGDDLSRAFSEYTSEASRRLQHDMQFPNEPKQVRQGEGVTFTPDGHVQVSGQISVMNINGLLTKVIFDHNPDNAFYVEESFPLDWMFPHLTPYGVIMKINRQPLPEITDEICKRDHEFWSKYSERLIGNWITYDTSVKEIADFVQRVYLGRNFKGFTGSPTFVRDDQAQKSFSKLRSSIAGIYSWRLGIPPGGGAPVPPQYLPKNQADRDRMIREADFAFKQSFAFCPYSPEAVYRYVNLLLSMGRVPDALLVAETCLKLDPYNQQVLNLVRGLRGAR